MAVELITNCDRCGSMMKVLREAQGGETFYLVHGLFCINMPAFFCSKECLEAALSEIKSFNYLDRDDEGKTVLDIDVIINESLLLDKMYDIVYDVENPLFPALVLQRVLSVDPENVRLLYALASLYVGLIAAENTSEELRGRLRERLKEVETDLEGLSPEGYKRLAGVKEHYGV